MEQKDLDRFLKKVEITDSCWLWTAYLDKDGYGTFGLNGKIKKAHRVSYEMFVGPIPIGLEIDHLCKRRNCVTPNHLEAVTHLENIRRGEGFDLGSMQRSKTSCPQYHEYSLKNTSITSKGFRRCRECDKLRHREHRRKRDCG